MDIHSRKPPLPSGTGQAAWLFILLGVSAALVLGYLFLETRERNDAEAVFRAVCAIKNGELTLSGKEPGYWTGDVTELYRLGLVSKEVAESDASPITPLVDRPRPYHGYFFVAMESGPGSQGDRGPVALKGLQRNKQVYAFCAYPAGGGRPELPVYIICPWGIFKKESGGSNPVLEWPTDDQIQRSWWRSC